MNTDKELGTKSKKTKITCYYFQSGFKGKDFSGYLKAYLVLLHLLYPNTFSRLSGFLEDEL